MFLLDRTLAVYPAEIALVEDVQWLERGQPRAPYNTEEALGFVR